MDEPFGILLIVDVVLAEGGVRGLVQRVRAFPSRDREAALEELQPHRTGHPLLRARDRGIERIPLRRPPATVVHQVGVAERKLILEAERAPVEHQLFQLAVRRMQQRAARDRKSTRLNSSHGYISYAVFCLKKKNTQR